jgi:glycosyltransferase involved in cell wall biosynthesis
MPKQLKIAIDIRDLRIAKTGTRTYLEEICREFKKMQSNQIRFYFFDTSIPVYTGSNKLLKIIEHLRYQLWKQLLLPFKAFFKGCDVVFCVDNFVPLIHLGYQTIPVFHDAFFFESPENYGKLWLWLYYKTAVPAARKSAFVVTPTAYAKKQIQHFTQIQNEKLVIVHEGPKSLADVKHNIESEKLLQSFSLLPSQYILHVGSMFKRKNLPALIAAFSKVKKAGFKQLKLVLAGPVPTAATETDYALILNSIKTNDLENDVVLTGYLPNDKLSFLYQHALMYVFPSVNEGFGIPILEAFAQNVPVLVADNTCLPEVGGNAVITFDPFDTDAIFKAIKTVLDDEELRKEMIRKGQQRLKDFSWQKTASQLVEVFKEAANYS